MTNVLNNKQMAHPDVSDAELLRCLKAAHDLMTNPRGEPDATEWARNPTPVPPYGIVKFEVARQFAVFLLPGLVLAFAALMYGLTGALMAALPAWALGYLLDRQLDNSITRQARREAYADRGRYLTVHFIAERFNCRPEQVTLAKIRSYSKLFERNAELQAASEAEKAAARAASKEDFRKRNSRRHARDYAVAAGAGAAAGVAYGSVDEDGVIHRAGDDFYGSVNPANGLPMISGTPLDVGGNVFGTDNHSYGGGDFGGGFGGTDY